MEVRYATYGMGEKSEVCIYASEEKPELKVSESCTGERVNDVTAFFLTVEAELKKFGSANVEVHRNYYKRIKSFQPVKEYGDRQLYKVRSREDLVTLLGFDNMPVPYYQLTNLQARLIKDRAQFD